MALKLFIDGKPKSAPIEWKDTQIKAAYGTNTNQPSIESDRFTLVRDAAQSVLNHVNNNKIFEELPSTMEFDLVNIFDGFIDTSDELEILDVSFGQNNEQPNQVNAKFKKNSAIQYFSEKVNGVSYGSLLEEGVITSSDYTTIQTVVRKRFDFIDFAIMLVSIYLLQKQLRDTIKELKDSFQDISFKSTASLTSSIPAAIYAVLYFALRVAYAIALLALITNLVVQLIRLIIPPRVKNKGIRFSTLLEKACAKFGYTFESNIKELDIYCYLPSKPFNNSEGITEQIADFFIPQIKPNKIGIPSTSDYGYLINEMFDLCSNMFNARTDVVGNRVLLYNSDDPIWFKQSTFTPSINLKLGNKKYNTNDLPQTRLFSFQTDPTDEWTIENYTGTSYEVKTQLKNGNLGTIKGVDRIDIPLCLPNAKTETTALEEVVYQMAKVADSLTKALGQRSSYASDFEQSVNNVLMISNPQYSIPKIVPIQGGRIPKNHRNTILSAKYLWNKFHFGKSWVTGDKLGQKVIYNDVEIPFNIENLQQTIENGSFILPDGRKARFVENTYLLGRDIATANIEVQEVYTDNLEEVYYEP